MELSEREQQVLRDLEQQLRADDPSLASSMAKAEKKIARPSPRHVGVGVALVLVGLAVVLAGVVVGHGLWGVLIGVVGFALAVWGVTLMLTTREVPGGDAQRTSGGRGGRGPRGEGRRSGSSFMDRQSERWDRRRDGDR